MNNQIIIQELQNEANTYKNDQSKIFKYRALNKAIVSIQRCDLNITSGSFVLKIVIILVKVFQIVLIKF